MHILGFKVVIMHFISFCCLIKYRLRHITIRLFSELFLNIESSSKRLTQLFFKIIYKSLTSLRKQKPDQVINDLLNKF